MAQIPGFSSLSTSIHIPDATHSRHVSYHPNLLKGVVAPVVRSMRKLYRILEHVGFVRTRRSGELKDLAKREAVGYMLNLSRLR